MPAAPRHPLADDARCPCLSGLPYGECCGPLHAGSRTAATAEQLMRSRFTAFAVGDAAYLRATWHPATRPVELELDDETRWIRLDIEATAGGGPFDQRGEVEFTAFWRSSDGTRGTLHERSRFVREGGRWTYVDGDVA